MNIVFFLKFFSGVSYTFVTDPSTTDRTEKLLSTSDFEVNPMKMEKRIVSWLINFMLKLPMRMIDLFSALAISILVDNPSRKTSIKLC